MSFRVWRWLSWTGFSLVTFLVGCQSEIPRETPKGTSSGGALANRPSEGGAAGVKRLVVLINGDSPFWDACRAGINDAKTQFHLTQAGFDAVMESNDGTPQGQLDKLRQYGSQTDIAGVAISATDATNAAIADELRGLQKKGVAIITIDSDLDRDTARDARYAFIGTDNLIAGKLLGQCATAVQPNGGAYVSFFGRAGAQNVIERLAGFADAAGSKLTAKDKMADDTDRPRARDNVRNAMANHPDVNTLVGIWSYNAPAIVDVVREKQARDKYKVCVFDAEPQTLQAMADGDVDVLVVQDPYAMGLLGVRLLKAIVAKEQATLTELLPNHGQPGGDILETGLKVVIPNAQSPVKTLELGPKVEVLTLEAFNAWLDKYGLTGS